MNALGPNSHSGTFLKQVPSNDAARNGASLRQRDEVGPELAAPGQVRG